MRRGKAALVTIAIAIVAIAACQSSQPTARVEEPAPTASSATTTTPPPVAVALDASIALAEEDAAAPPPLAAASTNPMDTHQSTREGLLGLFWSSSEPNAFLDKTFGVDGPTKMNQGNKAIARHLISKEKCLEGLRANNIVVQTPEQRAKCGGAENMVPIWTGAKGAAASSTPSSDKDHPAYCIDVFEFPNRTCELPMVWTPPAQAKKVCELQGKRLCTDTEWNVACRADPEGGADQKYAYGEKLDLAVCNTSLAHRTACNPRGPSTAWGTCSTDTEPSGSYPKCRSRFGVFDQHGNVAEVMTRNEPASAGKPAQVVTQLKGSAWFYVELAKEPGQPVPASTPFKEGAYPDHCNFDPRWHVEPIDQGIHTNYHLGFRCCRSIDATTH